MGRFGRGLKLAETSFRVIVADPVLLLVVLAGVIGTVIVSGGLYLAIFRHLPAEADFTFPRELVALPVLWLGTAVSSYCAVVVAVMADRRLRGGTPRLGEAIAVANSRLGRILTWTLISMAVGLVVQLIVERIKLGWLVSRIFGTAWALATMFVIPVIAFEEVGVRESIRRSSGMFRAKWGESMVADGAISAVAFVATIPIAVVAIAVGTINTTAGVVVGIVLGVALWLLSTALDTIVDVALYRYAMDGHAVGGFTPVQLYGSFRPKR